ncbi:MAG: hypothetical protein M3N31_01315 [Actinomycetota bacterium]|nr:hypothetical protein [Actinomycetota bacterium]
MNDTRAKLSSGSAEVDSVQTPHHADHTPSRALTMVRRLDVRRLAIVLGALALGLGGMGVVRALVKSRTGWSIPFFGLDTEWSAPAFFTGGVLVSAAAVYLLAARKGVFEQVSGRAVAGLGLFLAYMGIDEVVQLHERMERAFDRGWQSLYLPLVALGGLAWALCVKGRWPTPLARPCLLAAAGAWVTAQGLERIQRQDGVLVNRWSILPEEMLEMAGSVLFLVGALVAIQAGLRHREASPAAPDGSGGGQS